MVECGELVIPQQCQSACCFATFSTCFFATSNPIYLFATTNTFSQHLVYSTRYTSMAVQMQFDIHSFWTLWYTCDIGTTKIFVLYKYFFSEISAINFFMFAFCWEHKFLIGQSTKFFSVTGVEKKVNKLDRLYFGLLVAIYQKPKDKNMGWAGH